MHEMTNRWGMRKLLSCLSQNLLSDLMSTSILYHAWIKVASHGANLCFKIKSIQFQTFLFELVVQVKEGGGPRLSLVSGGLLYLPVSASLGAEAQKKPIKAYLNEEGRDTMALSESWAVIKEVDEMSRPSTPSPVVKSLDFSLCQYSRTC